MNKSDQERHDESIIDAVIDTIGDSIEAITNAIASVFKSDQDDLHDRDNGF